MTSSRACRKDSILTLDTLETLYPERSARLETEIEVEDIVLNEERPEKVIKIGRGLLKET